MKPIFKIGDSVKVKKGVTDPDMKELCIEGWQGRIVQITKDDDNKACVDVSWDSITLQNMPKHVIEKCEEDGLDCTLCGLYADEVELASPRDTEADAQKAAANMEKSHDWSFLGDQGKRIAKVVAGMNQNEDENEDNILELLDAWEAFLEENLSFPFEAKVSESQDKGPLRLGDKVKVKEIELTDDLYGIIVQVWHNKKKYAFPLCDLEVIGKTSSNHQHVDDYSVWFSNR